jgi:ATP-binding protein involved in chromosome partitioning
MSATRDAVVAALSNVREPALGRPITELGMVRGADVDAQGAAIVDLALNNPEYPHRDALSQEVERVVRSIAGVSGVKVRFQSAAPSSRQIAADDPVPGVRNVILVMSGKGGVGKSTVSANLALALARAGQRVGLLDADIYGPSIPTMLGITGRPMSDGSRIRPLERFGVKLMSIGFLLDDPTTAVVWRGPMLHGALLQFLKDVDWGELDYLLLDLPPGTGDIALTLSQRVRTSGAVIVTTPQEVALQDVYKAVSMCQKVGIPLLGVVENESWFTCSKCSERHELFGAGGGQKVAEFASAPLLGQIPMHPAVREWGDAGTPVVQAAPGSEIAQSFVAVAERLSERIAAASSEQSGGLVIDRSGGVNRHLPITR